MAYLWETSVIQTRQSMASTLPWFKRHEILVLQSLQGVLKGQAVMGSEKLRAERSLERGSV